MFICSLVLSSLSLGTLVQAQDYDQQIENQTNTINTLSQQQQDKTAEIEAIEATIATNQTTVTQLNAEIEKNDLQAQKTIEENKKATFIAQKEEAQKKLAEEQRAQEQALKEQQIKETEKEQQVQEQKQQEQEVQKAAIQTPKIESAQKEVAEETPIPVTKEDQVDHTVTTPEENVTVPTNTETASNGKQAAAQATLSEVGTARATGWNAPGECLVSVRRWLGAGGITFGYGDVHSGYVNSGAREISWGDIQVGDVIQYENVYTPDGWIGGIHTMLVVAVTNGQATIVESNNPEGSGYVSKRENWSPTPPAGFRAAIWRFPG